MVYHIRVKAPNLIQKTFTTCFLSLSKAVMLAPPYVYLQLHCLLSSQCFDSPSFISRLSPFFSAMA